MDDITAVILCGGLGTRLRSISGNRPKPMVNVAERPFLEYILDYLIEQGISKAVLAVSYQKEFIIKHFGNRYKSLDINYSIETEALGTGGAIKFAMEQFCAAKDQLVLVINGDTFVEYSVENMRSKLATTYADFVMALSYLDDTSRYGRVKVINNKITEFEEKQCGQAGLINAGVYLFSNTLDTLFPQHASFSFEQGVLEHLIHTHTVLPSISSGYFIDIGVPEDYLKAQKDMMPFDRER